MVFWLVHQNLRRENLRKELKLKSTDREKKMQRAFATALELQQHTEEKATALKAELAKIKHSTQQEIDALKEQVDWRGYANQPTAPSSIMTL